MKFMRFSIFGTVMLMANGAAAQNSVKPFHLDEATISDVHAAYKSGALTSVKLVQAYLDAAGLRPGGPEAQCGDLSQSSGLGRGDSDRLRLQKRSELQQRVIMIMADERLDAIMFPHQKRLMVPIGETQVERNGAVGSVTGFPSIVVPGGFSSPTPTATLGVPAGIEFLGRPWSEKLLVEIGYGYEQATKHRRPPPTIPPIRLLTTNHRRSVSSD